MPRPVPHSGFLTDLSRKLRASRIDPLASPVLLAANPVGKFAVLNDAGGPDLHLYDRKIAKVTAKLALPPRWRKPTDYRHFAFSDDGLYTGAYYPSDKSFAVWSTEGGWLANQIQGEGTITGRMTFLPNNKVATCDGQWVYMHELGGGLVSRTKLPQEIESIILYSASGMDMGIVAVGAFRKETGGYQVRCYILQGGKILSTDDGPYRAGPLKRGDRKSVKFEEIHPVPGSTRRVLILCEEECTQHNPDDSMSLDPDEFDTHLLGIDPVSGKFYPEEIYLSGRYCVEMNGPEMHLLDERGFRRRLSPFPLRLDIIDWRLAQ